MRKGLIFCTVLAAAGLCLWLGLRNSGPYEPVYLGKRLGYWLKIDTRASTTFEDRIAAQAVFRALDTNAVPFLVARLERDAIRASHEAEFNALVDKLHLPATLKLPNTATNNSSAVALVFMGRSARPGLLRVFEETSNTYVLNSAAQSLLDSLYFASGGRLKGLASWNRYLIEQKDTMPQAAWQRLTNAVVIQHSY